MLTAFHSSPFLKRLCRWRYTWAIFPAIVIVALSTNNHLYYDIFYGYDMPHHFLNAHIIVNTGAPPTPETNFPDNYEAHQAPIFYILASWMLRIGDPIVGDSMQGLAETVLWCIDLLWLGILIYSIERILRRANPIVKALTLAVVMLFPMHIMARTMFGNDLPVIMFGTLAAFALWRVGRINHAKDRGAWLRAAALCGFAVVFKNNGVVLLGSYLALAGFIVLHKLLWRRWGDAFTVSKYAALGVPLAVVPFFVNNYHTLQFIDDPIGAMGVIPIIPLEPPNHLRFLTSFDPTLFLSPFAYSYGHRGYWSLEYVTLHSDYYNHWTSDAFLTWDHSVMTVMQHRFPIPTARYHDLQLLQLLAIPVSFVIVFAFVYACYRCLFHWRYAVRDGSALVALFTGMAHGAQMVRYLAYPYVDAVIIHARYIGFLWLFLFIVGMYWLAKLLRGNRGWQGTVAGAGLALMAAYCFIALRAMWLPPI